MQATTMAGDGRLSGIRRIFIPPGFWAARSINPCDIGCEADSVADATRCLGAGGVGSFLGAALARAGRDVLLLYVPADQPRQRTTSTAITAPVGGCARYCWYLDRRSARACSRSEPVSSTLAVPSSLTHHSRVQSSS